MDDDLRIETHGDSGMPLPLGGRPKGAMNSCKSYRKRLLLIPSTNLTKLTIPTNLTKLTDPTKLTHPTERTNPTNLANLSEKPNQAY